MPGRGLEGKHLGDATHEVVFDSWRCHARSRIRLRR
jgi:hypothetical protein